MRAQLVLSCAGGKSNGAVARGLRTSPQTVCKWRGRFLRARLDGLLDEPRPGTPRRVGEERVERVAAGDPGIAATESTCTFTTSIPNPSSGIKPPTKSSNRLPDFVNAFQTEDTRSASDSFVEA
jgi:hypothetical protein